MEQKIAKKLTWYYYGMLALAVAVAGLMTYLGWNQSLPQIDPFATLGQVIQYVVIAIVIITVPGALWLFKRLCNTLKKETDEDIRLERYFKGAMIRILVIGVGISLGILAYYLLGGYQSMLFCAAVSAIGLIFCKPNARNIQLDLLDEEQI